MIITQKTTMLAFQVHDGKECPGDRKGSSSSFSYNILWVCLCSFDVWVEKNDISLIPTSPRFPGMCKKREDLTANQRLHAVEYVFITVYTFNFHRHALQCALASIDMPCSVRWLSVDDRNIGCVDF